MIAPKFGRQPAEVEHLNLELRLVREDLARQHRQPPRLRRFAGAGVLAAAGGVDQEDARGRGRVVLLAFGVLDLLAGGDPVDRELIVGIGEARSGRTRVRRLARLLDRAARRLRGCDRCSLRSGAKTGSENRSQYRFSEFVLAEFDRRHLLANVEAHHRARLVNPGQGRNCPGTPIRNASVWFLGGRRTGQVLRSSLTTSPASLKAWFAAGTPQ